MNNFYATKKRLTSLCLLAVGLVSFNANSQCTAVATFTEDFTGLTALPNCWKGSLSNHGIGVTGGALMLYSGGASGTEIIIATPEVSTIDGNHILSFDVISVQGQPTGISLQVGTMTDNTNFSTFTGFGSTFTPTAGLKHTSAAIPATSGHKYVAVKYTFPAGSHIVVNLDNFEWKSSLSTPKFDTSKVTVYPNPTSGIFNVDSELNIAQIEVFNVTGQKVLTTANKEINLQNAANGLYFVTVTTNQGTQGTYKLIKK